MLPLLDWTPQTTLDKKLLQGFLSDRKTTVRPKPKQTGIAPSDQLEFTNASEMPLRGSTTIKSASNLKENRRHSLLEPDALNSAFDA